MRDRTDVDCQLGQLQTNVTNVTHRLDVVEAITKNWDKMQQELTLMNTEVAAIRSTQTGLHSLMEGLAKQMEDLTSGGPTQEETSAEIGVGLGDSQVQVPPSQTELGTIPEEESAWSFDSVLKDQPKTFSWGASAAPSASPVLGTPIFNSPMSVRQQSQEPVRPIIP